MATTPNSLTSATSVAKIDGVDLHDYGVVINRVTNPVPRAKNSSIAIPGKSGDFDYARKYEPRFITLSGRIVADNHAQLVANLDELKSWLRLRESRDSMELIFQDQTDRYWTIRYDGEFSLESPAGNWYACTSLAFTLQFKCLKPYAEKTTVTNETVTNFNIFRKKTITYAGNIPTPLNITLWPHIVENLFEKNGGSSEATTGWSVTNGALSAVNGPYEWMYGDYGIKNVGNGSTPSVMYRDIYSSIDTDKYYVALAYMYSEDSTDVYLNVTGDVSLDKDGNSLKVTDHWGISFVKLQPSDFIGESELNIRIVSDTASVTFFVDGVSVYEITSDEYSDDNYVPPPYTTYTSGGRKLVDPTFHLFSSINLLEKGKGDDDGDVWRGTYGSGIEELPSVQDPFDPDKKCFHIKGEEYVTTPPVFINPLKDYHIRFDYYANDLAAGAPFVLDIIHNHEGAIQSSGYTAQLVWTTSTPVSNWTEKTYQLDRNTLGAAHLMVQFYVYSGAHVFLKNVQIVEVDTHSSSVDDYIDHSELLLESSGLTLEENDMLSIDNGRMIYYFFDNSSDDMNNAAQYFSGDMLLLKPGINILQMKDSRYNSSTPEDQSIGAAKKMILSYRERYL